LLFLKENSGEIPTEEKTIKNPSGGYSSKLKNVLPEFIYVPAVRYISGEAKVNKTNSFGKLVGSILQKMSTEQKSLISDKLEETGKLLNRSGNEKRITEINDLEINLNKFMSELIECDIEIEIPMPRLEEIFG